LVLPAVLLAALIGVGVFLFVRGTWADDQPRNPARPEDGPVAQVYQPPGEPKRVRCAMLLAQPPERVWRAVTDYENYAAFLPYLASIQVERRPGGCHMTGRARSLLGDHWPFAIDIREERSDKASTARWDEKGEGQVRLNRGGWEVIPAGTDQTLLVLSLETEVHNYPTFIIRNAYLHRLKAVLRQVDQHLRATAGPR
jgi:ribosome-associated toxin RatA of RatAB toxin-antitoxin module